ncbi:MAG: toll/interleukin-1 receptor domain-containing protein [Xanthobacteraceae bacterium]
MAKQKVFISYRRDDAAGFSHAIHDRLLEHLPNQRVFRDVLGIESGADFVTKLEAALDQCGVLLVLIGKRWAGSDPTGTSRLQNARDWVRIEVQTALRRGIKVIPVLLDGATMPAEASLPEELRSLVRLQAVDLRTSRLDADVWDLVGAVMRALGETWPPAAPGGPIYAISSGIYAFFAGASLLFLLIASMFTETSAAAVLGIGGFVLNAVVILRLPILAKIHNLTRQGALRIGAGLHLAAFSALMMGDGSADGVIVFVFGLVPAALLFLAAFAMQRRAHSSVPMSAAAGWHAAR